MNARPDSSPGSLVAASLAAAAIYFALGALGLGLAIPPGYASPIFPAAGFAVAILLVSERRAWPGIALGSLLLNLYAGDLGAATRVATLISALGIAAGSTVQALVATRFIERVAGRSWESMEVARDIVRILAFGGPVACLIAATIGVGTLYLNGLTPASDVLFTWWNWWAGDTLGVLIALPLCLTVALHSRSPWRARRVTLIPPLLTALLVVTGGYVAVSHWERLTRDEAVIHHGEELARRLSQRFIAHQEALAALKRVVEVSPDMSYAQFDHFTRITLRENPDIFALSLNPFVRRSDRAAIERQMARTTQDPGFEIRERDAQKRLTRAGDRPDHVIVGYISPLEGNRPAIGYDINSEPLRQEAIRRARESRQPSVTAPLQLVQENQKRVGALLLHPAYKTAISGAEPVDGDLAGFAVGVIKLDQMVQIATDPMRVSGLAFHIDDVTGGLHSMVFDSEGAAPSPHQANVFKMSLAMADRDWELRVYPTAAWQPANRPWIAWATAVVGLVLVTLLQVLLLVTSGQAAAARRRLRQQHKELEVQGVALQDRTALITTLFELSPDGFVALAPNGTILFANHAFHAMTGVPSNFIGQSIGSLDSHLRQCAEQSARYVPLEAMFAEPNVSSVSQTLTLARPRQAVLQMLGVRSSAASFDRFIHFRDVTHETEVDRLKSEFLSTAAHELRTPMASIYGFAELLIAQEFDEDDRRDFLNTIFRQSGLMVSIINELLDIARIEARRGKDFVIGPVDLHELLDGVVSGFKAPDGRPSPRPAPAGGPLMVSADRGKLIQTVNNVLSNAYKYSPDGGAVEIDLIDARGEVPPRVGIRITDHGIGMTPEQLARVCERFYRADTSGNIPGTGLGMAIVKEIVELHGGTLEIDSKVGAGTTVTIWLPAVPPETAQAG